MHHCELVYWHFERKYEIIKEKDRYDENRSIFSKFISHSIQLYSIPDNVVHVTCAILILVCLTLAYSNHTCFEFLMKPDLWFEQHVFLFVLTLILINISKKSIYLFTWISDPKLIYTYYIWIVYMVDPSSFYIRKATLQPNNDSKFFQL